MTRHVTTPGQTGCPEHTHCAYTGSEADRCPFCHCPWDHVAAPNVEVVTHVGRSRKTGEQTVTNEVRQLVGCGHFPLQHLTLHVEERRRMAANKARARREGAQQPRTPISGINSGNAA